MFFALKYYTIEKITGHFSAILPARIKPRPELEQVA